MTDTDRKLAEEILLSKFPLLPKSTNKEGVELIINAMDEYFTGRLKSISPTDEEINALAEEHSLVEDEDDPGETRPDMWEYVAYKAGFHACLEKLTDKSEEKQKADISKEVRRITSLKDDGCHNCSVKDCRIYSSGKKCGNYRGYPKSEPFDKAEIIPTDTTRPYGCWNCGTQKCGSFGSNMDVVCTQWSQKGAQFDEETK